MKTFEKALLHLAIAATAVAGFSGTAFAQHRNDDVGPVTLSAQFNYGIWTGDDVNGYDLNAFGPGLGVRVGYTLDMGLYLGANFDYFFGDSQNAGGGVAGLATAGGSVRYNQYDFLAEIGYDAWIYRSGVLRPKLGLGVGIAHVSGCANFNVLGVGGTGCDGDSKSGFALAPGVQFMHYFSNVYLTAELRYQHDFIDDSPDPSAVVLGIGVGAAF
ncbi:MAG TPA: autotransporter outer membrane beta-barrel domain-containing protein [Polyangiaceae bacterium]|nr:autotransporter outer membrane beta-barrel domain-containing protein [Polyangiaceae bacterium]